LREPKIALIVGAGFSTEAGLPTTAQLGGKFLEVPRARRFEQIEEKLKQEIDKTISKELSAFWGAAFHSTSNDNHPSLEDHFTVIDLAANTGHHLGPDFSPRRLRLIRRLSIHRAFQILDSHFEPSPAIHELLGTLVRPGRSSLVCINWDIVLEKHLLNLNAPYNYGESVLPLKRETHPRETKGLPLLKLHGSTNWVYCDSCRNLFAGTPDEGKSAIHRSVFLEPDDFRYLHKPTLAKQIGARGIRDRECRICRCLLTARVGTFSYRKDYAIQQFQAIWHQAHSELRQSDAWLFVGYSMPGADFEFRHLLKSAQMANPVSKRKKQIQVILKDDGDAARRYQRFFGLGDRQISQSGLTMWASESLRDWIEGIRLLE
jgi:hypothetical protein